MEIKELRNRIKNALILLADGYPLNVGELTLTATDQKHLIIIGWTNNNLLENVTQQSALAELKDIKSLFEKMIDTSIDLSDFIKDKQIEYSLNYNYGMGSICLCREKNEQIYWETEIKK